MFFPLLLLVEIEKVFTRLCAFRIYTSICKQTVLASFWVFIYACCVYVCARLATRALGLYYSRLMCFIYYKNVSAQQSVWTNVMCWWSGVEPKIAYMPILFIYNTLMQPNRRTSQCMLYIYYIAYTNTYIFWNKFSGRSK